MKSKLLADGVRRCLATMTSCSLFQGVGAGRVKEVSLWWFG
ncbi:Os12g0501133 [Oryza sativa Japonica Group]|nr:Os12g0501133 [Oryza sativa Japonica Group]